MSGTANEIHLHLNDVKNFFQVPEIDPFEGDDLDVSGIDQLMDALKAQSGWKTRILRVIVHLPNEKASDSRIANMMKYISRHCDKNILYNRREMTEFRLEGRYALRMGILFLFVCLGLSAATEAVVGSERLLGQVLVEGFIIAGWVGLWHPLELLLYAWWPNARDIRLYEKIKSMRLDFVFDHERA